MACGVTVFFEYQYEYEPHLEQVRAYDGKAGDALAWKKRRSAELSSASGRLSTNRT